ncbi:MAG TPA: SMI1/KNR4 family protein [Pseudonocardiaceae bacterium]|nr:SMI1/KNR4 family protein [Pseudonocardiaceae bacterium]
MNEVERSWQRIENWLRDNAPETYATLNPPATEAAIAEAEEFVGVPFPPDVVASLRVHDGIAPQPGAFHLAGRYSLASVERIKNCWKMLTDLLLEEFNTEGMVGEWWHPQWVPVAEDNAACQLIFDGRPDADHNRIAVRDKESGAWWSHDRFTWTSLGALLADTADLLYGNTTDDHAVPVVRSRRLSWAWRDQITDRPPSLLTLASPAPQGKTLPNSPEWILDAGWCCLTFAKSEEALITAFGGDPSATDAPHGYLPTIRVGRVGDWTFAFEQQNRPIGCTEPVLRQLPAAVSISVLGDDIDVVSVRQGELVHQELLPPDPDRYLDDDILAALALAVRLGPGEFDPGLLNGPLRTVSVLPMLPEPATEPRKAHVEFDPDLIAAIEYADERQLRVAVANALRQAVRAAGLDDHPEIGAALNAALPAPTGPIDNAAPLGKLLRTLHAEANAAYASRLDRDARNSVAEPDRRAWQQRARVATVISEFVARPALVAAYSLVTFTDQFSQRAVLLDALADVVIPPDAVQRLTEAQQPPRPAAPLTVPVRRKRRERPAPPPVRRQVWIRHRGQPS